MKTAISFLALTALLAACEKEVILPGERFGTRTPLEDSIPTEANPAPRDLAAAVNQSVPIALPAAVANADWTHRGGNVRHLPPHGTLSASPARVWSASIGQASTRRNRISAAPVVAEGRVFTLDAEMGLHATALSGAPLWGSDLTPAGDRPSDVSGGGLAYGAGRVFIATGYGELIAVDPASGAVQWRQQLGAAVAGAPAVDGNTVYVVGRDSAGWAVNAADGKVLWQINGATGKPGMVGSAAPAVTERLVVLPMPSGELRAVLKTGGIEVWEADIAGARLAAPMVQLAESATAPAQYAFDQDQIRATARSHPRTPDDPHTVGLSALFTFVISGAAPWLGRPHDQIASAVIAQAGAALRPSIGRAPIELIRIVTEKRATFRCTPGLVRPPAVLAPGLLAAGDYIDGPYPATLEGAVRAGRAAVDLIRAPHLAALRPG